MPTFNQLVRKGRQTTAKKSTAPALQKGYNSLQKKATDNSTKQPKLLKKHIIQEWQLSYGVTFEMMLLKQIKKIIMHQLMKRTGWIANKNRFHSCHSFHCAGQAYSSVLPQEGFAVGLEGRSGRSIISFILQKIKENHKSIIFLFLHAKIKLKVQYILR